MNVVKIALWLLLAITFVYKSECKTPKYLVDNSRRLKRTNNGYDDSCFCFKNPGSHLNVPEILSQDQGNLERLVVYLYKDKDTDRIKIFVPNAEKQALIPDLAFEVGDKLVTAEDEKIIDIFPHDANNVDHHLPQNNEILPIEIYKPDEVQYDDRWYHIQPPIDVNSIEVEELEVVPDSFYINSHDHGQHENPFFIDDYEDKDQEMDIQYDDRWHHIQPPIDVKSIEVEEIEVVPDSFYINSHDHGQHENPFFIDDYEDKDQEMDILVEEVFDNPIIGQPVIDTYEISKPNILIKPAENIYEDVSNTKTPNVNIIPTEIKVNNMNDLPEIIHEIDEYILPENIFSEKIYDWQHEKPLVNNIDVINQIIIPIEELPDNFNFNSHEEPYVHVNDVRKPIVQPLIDINNHYWQNENKPYQINIPDNFKYHEQHGQPHVFNEIYTPSEEYPNNFNYYDLYKTPQYITKPINLDDNYISINDNPYHYLEQGVPFKISENTFIINDGFPNGIWNIDSHNGINLPLHDNRDFIINSVHKDHSPDNKHYHDRPKTSGIFDEIVEISISESNESSEEIIDSILYQVEDLSKDTSQADVSPREDNSIEYSWFESISSIENNESEEIETEIDIDIVDDSKTTKTKSDMNKYETFDRWFIQQMQRFKTYTVHDIVVNLNIIERYIIEILRDNGMLVTSEGVLTDSFGTALDIHNLYLRPILIGNSMAFGSILDEKVQDLVLPANMAYLQGILVTNVNPPMVLGIIPIGKTVIPPSTINTIKALYKPNHHSSTVKLSLPINVSGWTNKIPIHHLDNTKHWKQNQDRKMNENIITVVKENPAVLSHRQRQPETSAQFYGTGSQDFNIVSDNSDNPFKKLSISLAHTESSDSEEATKNLVSALRTNDPLFFSIETSHNATSIEEEIDGRIVGGSAATGSGAPLSMKGRMKDF